MTLKVEKTQQAKQKKKLKLLTLKDVLHTRPGKFKFKIFIRWQHTHMHDTQHNHNIFTIESTSEGSGVWHLLSSLCSAGEGTSSGSLGLWRRRWSASHRMGSAGRSLANAVRAGIRVGVMFLRM